MKFIFVFLGIVALVISILIIKSNNKAKIDNNGAETKGIVIEVFNRGKLPFCKFQYEVNGKLHTKKQELPKHLVKKVLNNTYTVKYEISNPQNALISFSK